MVRRLRSDEICDHMKSGQLHWWRRNQINTDHQHETPSS